MGRATQDGCKRPGWDEPARLTTVGKAEPLRGGLASESRISEGLPPDPSSSMFPMKRLHSQCRLGRNSPWGAKTRGRTMPEALSVPPQPRVTWGPLATTSEDWCW